MTYRAKATYPYIDQQRAVLGLRAQLRQQVVTEGATADWSTFRVVGPDEVIGRHGIVWYEWTATVDVREEADRYL